MTCCVMPAGAVMVPRLIAHDCFSPTGRIRARRFSLPAQQCLTTSVLVGLRSCLVESLEDHLTPKTRISTLLAPASLPQQSQALMPPAQASAADQVGPEAKREWKLEGSPLYGPAETVPGLSRSFPATTHQAHVVY